MENVEKLLEKKTIFTAAEARQITNIKAQKEKQINELLLRCHAHIRDAAIKGEEYTCVKQVPYFIHGELVSALESMGYEIAVDSWGTDTDVSLGVTW